MLPGIVRLKSTARNILRPARKRLKADASLSPFIFTEIFQCGKIGRIALESFAVHHPDTIVHVYGTSKDFSLVPTNKQFKLHDLSDQPRILNNFRHGHLGTASLWAKIILERPEKYLIHFDSDVIFRGSVTPEIIAKLKEGYSQVGPVRNYQHNPNNLANVRYLSDVTQTVCFGFDREKITQRDYATFTKMCQGLFNPYGHPVIDFFDPVSFDILRNDGRMYFLSSDDFGGCNRYGSRINKYSECNALIDFGDKLAHFAAVGSGMNFHINRGKITKSVAQSYIDYALEKYAIFCKIFYREDLDILYDRHKYQPLLEVTDWYGQSKDWP